MAFTYLLGSPDPEIVERSKLRLALGDTDEGRGPRANSRNFSDEELDVYLNEAGEVGTALRVESATAWLCEMLARDWSKVASLSIGPRSQQFGQVADQWAKRAAALITRYGLATGFAFSVAPNRSDGYSDNAAASEYG